MSGAGTKAEVTVARWTSAVGRGAEAAVHKIRIAQIDGGGFSRRALTDGLASALLSLAAGEAIVVSALSYDRSGAVFTAGSRYTENLIAFSQYGTAISLNDCMLAIVYGNQLFTVHTRAMVPFERGGLP